MTEEKENSEEDEEKEIEEEASPAVAEAEQPKRRFDPERLGTGNGEDRGEDDAIYVDDMIFLKDFQN